MSDFQKNSPEAVGAAVEAQDIVNQSELNFSTTVFKGTKNPRRIRALIALVFRDYVSRENLDKLAGCTNSPDLVSRLRKDGVDVQMREVHTKDRDGRSCWFGEYFLMPEVKRAIREWLEVAGHVNEAQYGQ